MIVQLVGIIKKSYIAVRSYKNKVNDRLKVWIKQLMKEVIEEILVENQEHISKVSKPDK
jgi:hypothetical protein